MINTPEETQKTLDWAVQQLSIRQKSKFYGKVTFVIEGGKITRSTTEESCVPPRAIK